jgi:hypothetical protein
MLLASVTNREPPGVPLVVYCYAVKHGMKVQIVNPYRVSHLQRYGVTESGNVTSVYLHLRYDLRKESPALYFERLNLTHVVKNTDCLIFTSTFMNCLTLQVKVLHSLETSDCSPSNTPLYTEDFSHQWADRVNLTSKAFDSLILWSRWIFQWTECFISVMIETALLYRSNSYLYLLYLLLSTYYSIITTTPRLNN